MIYLKEGKTPLNLAYNDEIVHEGNGKYQLTFKFPTENSTWELLTEETLLLADDLHGEQEFIIFEVERHHADITVYANQVATLLNNYSITELSVNNASGDRVMRSLVSSIIREHRFTFSSDIANTHNLNLKNITVANALFKGKHSILGQWGGDLIRDKYDIRLLSNGGTNKEVLFMYKKNLKTYQQKKSIKDLKTRIHFTKTINSQKEGEKDKVISVTVDSPFINKYKNIYESNLDVNEKEVTDETSLRRYGEQYFKTTLCDVLEETIEIDVVGTPDVEVGIFDTVTVFHERFNLDVKKKITKYTYSPMGKKLKTIGFGKIQSNLGSTLSNMVDNAVAEQVESKLDAFKIQKNLAELLKLDRKAIENKMADLEEKSKAAVEVKKALFEADGTIPNVVKTKILDAVEADIARLKTIITEAELIKAIQAHLNYAEIKNALIDKAFINQIISDEKFTQQFEEGQVTTQNIFTKLKDSIKSNIAKDFVTKDGVKKLVTDLTIDAEGIRQITQQETTKIFNENRQSLKGERGKSSYIHKKYSDNANGANMDNNPTRRYIGIYTGEKETPPENASEYSWTKIRGNDGINGRDGQDGRNGQDGRDGKDGEVNFNLLNGTKEFKRDSFGEPENWQRDLIWNVEPEKYKDFTVLSTIHDSNGLWQNVEVKQGKMYEYGFYAKANIAHNNATVGVSWGASTAKTPRIDGNPSDFRVQLTSDWKLHTFRFTAEKNGWTQTRLEQSGGMGAKKLFLCGLYLKEVKNNKTEPLGWSPSFEDLQSHTLTANLRFEGKYINSIGTDVKVYLDVFYDGKKIESGFDLKLKNKGGTRADWSGFWDASVETSGLVSFDSSWINGNLNGQALEFIALVTYRGLNTVANARLENIPDVAEIKETIRKYKTFESTLDRFNSTIGEVKEQVVSGNRNYITNSGSLDTKSFGSWGKWERTFQNGTMVCTKINGSDSTGFNMGLTDILKTQFQNETMTWSLEVKASRDCTFNHIGFETNGQRSFNLTTQWQRISHTFVNRFENYYQFTFYNPTRNFNTGDKIYIRFPKLEKGSVATEWSLAPEDVSLVKETLESSINQTKDKIELKVSKDNIISAINASVERNGNGYQGVVKINADKVDITGVLRAYAGYIGGFRLGPIGYYSGQYITGENQYSVGMSNGAANSPGRAALWVNWGRDWNTFPSNGWVVTHSGEMFANNGASFKGGVSMNGTLYIESSGDLMYKGTSLSTLLNNKMTIADIYRISRQSDANGPYVGFESHKGNVYCRASQWSDKRLKSNIAATKVDALDAINKLNVYEYDFKKEDTEYHKAIGLIAQEVGEHLPDAHETFKGIETYNPFFFIPYLVKSIQQLSAENEKLNKKLEELEDKINGKL